MATLIILQDGTVPVAADFNTNYINLNTEIRPEPTGGTGQSAYTTGDLLYASAANTLNRLSVGRRGQVLVVSSTGVPTWGGPALYKSGEDITVASSTTETSLLNGASVPGPYSLAASTLDVANRLRIFMVAKVTNTSGSTRTFTYKMKYGGTTLTTKAVSVITASTNLPLLLYGELVGDNGTSQQSGTMTTVFNTGTYDQQYGTAAVDSGTVLDLDVTMTLSANAATISYTMQYVMVELVV